MTLGEHRARHDELHRALDELAADWVSQKPSGRYFSNTTIMELMRWSNQQRIDPTGDLEEHPVPTQSKIIKGVIRDSEHAQSLPADRVQAMANVAVLAQQVGWPYIESLIRKAIESRAVSAPQEASQKALDSTAGDH